MDYLRDMNLLSIFARMLCALICGGAIGIERELKGKYAGFRTHIMICIASAMTTAMSQYMLLVLHQYNDVARLGAGVVAGLGFIGAGTIVVTQGRRIKGLTTAAGLWATGTIGLCAGAGFYEGALITTVLIIFAGTVIAKFEKKRFSQMNDIDLLVRLTDRAYLKDLLKYFRDVDIDVDGLSIDYEEDKKTVAGLFTIKLHRKISISGVIIDLEQFDFVDKAIVVEDD